MICCGLVGRLLIGVCVVDSCVLFCYWLVVGGLVCVCVSLVVCVCRLLVSRVVFDCVDD